MRGYCDVYKWTILKRTSPEVKCLHPTSSRRVMCTLSVSNVIYHKFSHGAAFYTLNGKNVNVMLESILNFELKVISYFKKVKNLKFNYDIILDLMNINVRQIRYTLSSLALVKII